MTPEPTKASESHVDALTRLWQVDQDGTGRGGRGRRLSLSRDAVVEAAIQLADESGIAAVSMQRVAQSLDFATMSLYRHVANKDELLLFMHDTAWRPLPAVTESNPSGRAWRVELASWCRDQQGVLRRHPWLEGIRPSERAGTPSQLAWLDRGLHILEHTPLTERDKTELLLMLTGYVLWEARVHAEAAAAPAAMSAGGGPGGFGDLLRGLVDPRRYPALSRSIDAGAFDDPLQAYADFTFGLDRILDGIETLTNQRSSERAAQPEPERPEAHGPTKLPQRNSTAGATRPLNDG